MPRMNVALITRGHVPRMKAMDWVYDLGRSVTLFTHTESDADRLRASFGDINVVVHGINAGIDSIAMIRDWVDAYYGDWYISVDDNVEGLYGLPPGDHDTEAWNFDFRRFEGRLTPEQINYYLDELRDECIRMGNTMGGFTDMSNGFFRKRKWNYINYIKTQVAVLKGGIKWHQWSPIVSSDLVRSVTEVVQNGSICMNKWVQTKKGFYQEGGIGSLADRWPAMEHTYEQLLSRYPGLLRVQHSKTHGRPKLYFSKRTFSSLARWKAEWERRDV